MKATGKVERGQLEEQLAELGEETAALETQLRKAEQNAATAAAMATSIARSQAVLADATVKAAALRVEAKKIESEMLKHDAGIEELAAVEKVLGLKGVRAHVLGSALFGLEAVANAWLSRISGGGLTVKVTPYTEKKTGGVSDSISIDVEGAGNGHGYRAASGGERKRIDIALLLALGDIAAAAHGHKPGTIFCDEIGDTLDAPAVLALSKALQDIARGGRAVVVISHSSDLQRTLQADARWSVDAGVLSTH
jgi:DNA repair exonuclease SbcCD ATPase subunit